MNEWQNHIVFNKEIRFGKATIKGTRIAVGDILTWLASGMTVKEIIDEHPLLREEHIIAALLYAAWRESSNKIIAA